jgi:peroxiredoxin
VEGGANRPRYPLGRQEPSEPKITEGMKALSFTLLNVRGQRVSLSSLRGRPLVLAFFEARGNAGQTLNQIQQLPEKYKDLKLSALAVETSPQTPSLPQRVAQFIAEQKIMMPVLVYGRDVADAYGVGVRGGVFLLDADQIVRGYADSRGPQGLREIMERLDLWSGNGSPTFGWRDDIRVGYGQALGELDQRGRPVPEDRRRPLPPLQAIRTLRSLIPPKELAVQVDDSALDPSLVSAAKRTIENAVKAWQGALPDLKVNYVENRDDANLLLKFLPRVLDPQDTTGTRTLCIYCRAIDEGPRRGGGRPRESEESSLKIVAQVGIEHGDGRKHGDTGVTHLVAAALGYGLGLDLCGGERGPGMRNSRNADARNDKTSIMTQNADAPGLALRPSLDDRLILRNVHSALHYQVGRLLVETRRYAEAQLEFKQVAPDTKFATLAQEELKKIPSSSASSK